MSVLRSDWLSSELELVKDEGPEILRSFVYSIESSSDDSDHSKRIFNTQTVNRRELKKQDR